MNDAWMNSNRLKKVKVTCKKHGMVVNHTLIVEKFGYQDEKKYYICWHCLGEFFSKDCTVEEIEIRGEK
jgi:hypothetical protein